MLRERHAANEPLAPARVLNLIVIVDREWKGEIANRLERAGRYHGSRTILCAVEEGRTTLDALATVSYDDPRGRLGVMWEKVEIDIGPEHLPALQTIVDPVLVAELPTVLWSPHRHDEAVQALLRPDRRDPARLRRLPVRGGRVRARRPRSATTPTWSTSPGCARPRGASGWRPASTCPTACAALQHVARARHPPSRRLERLARCCSPAGWPPGWAGSRCRWSCIRWTGARATLAGGAGEVKVVMRRVRSGGARPGRRDRLLRRRSCRCRWSAAWAAWTRPSSSATAPSSSGRSSAPRGARAGSSARGSARRCCASRPTGRRSTPRGSSATYDRHRSMSSPTRRRRAPG